MIAQMSRKWIVEFEFWPANYNVVIGRSMNPSVISMYMESEINWPNQPNILS